MVYSQAGMGSEHKDTATADRTYFFVCLIFESGHVVLAGLEWRALPASACLPSAGMKGPCYHFQPRYNILLDGSTSPAEWAPSIWIRKAQILTMSLIGRLCMSSQLSVMSGVAALWIRFWVKSESRSVQLWLVEICELSSGDRYCVWHTETRALGSALRSQDHRWPAGTWF